MSQVLDKLNLYGERKNLLENSNFEYWQILGTAEQNTDDTMLYDADQWWFISSVNASDAKCLRGTGPARSRYGVVCGREGANAGTVDITLAQPLHTKKVINLQGQDIVLSFDALKGVGFTSAADALDVHVVAGTDTNKGSLPLTGSVDVIDETITLTGSFQRYINLTGSVPANATSLIVYFKYTATGAASVTDDFTIGRAMLELGDKSSIYIPDDDEISSLERFLTKSYAPDVVPGTFVVNSGIRTFFLFTPTGTLDKGDNVTDLRKTMINTPGIVIYDPATGATGQGDLIGPGSLALAAAGINERSFYIINNADVTAIDGDRATFHFVADARLF